jgi:predicted GNAT family N-acyltransferase
MVRPVPATSVRPLRTRVLRPEWPAGRLLTFAEDDEPETAHLAAEQGGTAVGVGTVYPQSPPEALRDGIPEAAYAPGAAWQLRGMATAESVRGTGVGAAVLAACVEAVRRGGGAFLWCNARVGAVGFYARAGWTAFGDTFEVDGVGPHVAMWRTA